MDGSGPLLLSVLGESRRLPRLAGEDAVQSAIVLGFGCCPN